MSYHNTNGLKGETLKDARKRVNRQTEAVINLLTIIMPQQKVTASQVMSHCLNFNLLSPNTPITSIRRTLSDLSKENRLVKLAETRPGPLGRPEHLYILKENRLNPVNIQ